jgi:hypothetical protein
MPIASPIPCQFSPAVPRIVDQSGVFVAAAAAAAADHKVQSCTVAVSGQEVDVSEYGFPRRVTVGLVNLCRGLQAVPAMSCVRDLPSTCVPLPSLP